MRRDWVAWLVSGLVAALLGVAKPCSTHAQTTGRRDRVYLVQLAMALEGSRRLMLWVETHPSDNELARFAHPLAERYVEAASQLTPSARLSVAHPHLLLVVENVERAIDAASLGELSVFRQRARTVREELAILEGMLKQLKCKLPELAR